MSFCQFFFVVVVFQIMGVLIQLSHNKNFLAYLNAIVKFDQPWQQQKCYWNEQQVKQNKNSELAAHFLTLTLCCQTWSLLLIVIDFIRNNHGSPCKIMQVMTPYKLRWANPYLIYVVPFLHNPYYNNNYELLTSHKMLPVYVLFPQPKMERFIKGDGGRKIQSRNIRRELI